MRAALARRPRSSAVAWTGPYISAVGAAAAVDGSSLTPAYPAGAETGDLVVLVLANRQGGSTAFTAPTVSGSAWTQAQTTFTSLRLSVYYRRYTAGDTAGAFTASASGGYMGRMVAVKGVNTSTVLDVAAAVATASTQPMSAPSITTVTANSLLLTAFASTDDNVHGDPTTNSPTLVFADTTLLGNDMGVSLWTKNLPAAGATGATTVTQTTVGPDQWNAITLALRPV